MQYKGMNLCDFCFALVGQDGICKNCGLNHSNYTLEAGLLVPGTILEGKYVIGKLLGRGGFGATYLAFCASTERVVAIKEYFPVGISYREPGQLNVNVISQEKKSVFDKGAKRFFEEAQTISRFNSSENIVSVYEFFYANNTVYYAMEYLDGVDLKKYILQKGGRLSEQEVIKIAKAVCNALMLVHSTQILHRDIAPDNIFMCRNGMIKLIDFGAAKQVVSDAQQGYSVVLKQGFAPVEQYASNGKQGVWTDIYALGATMYYMLTGSVPPDAMTLSDTGVRFDPSLRISDNLVWIVGRCLEFKIENRFQSVFELSGALDNLVVRPNVAPPPVINQQVQYKYNNPQPKKKSQNKLIFALSSVAVLLLCVITVLLANPSILQGERESVDIIRGTKEEYKDVLVEIDDSYDEVDDVPDNTIDNDEISNIINRYSSYTDFGIYVKNLTNGYEYGYSEKDTFLASAMSQIVILNSLSEEVKEKNIDLNREIVYFSYMPNGKEAPTSKQENGQYVYIKKCIEDVAIYGDNNKSNLLVDYLGEINSEADGFTVINRITRNNGYVNTRISRKIFTNANYIDNNALPNVTTPQEIASMFTSLINESSFGNSAYMKSIFKSVSNDGQAIGINKFIPGYYTVSCANALNSQSTNNVAIIEYNNQKIVVAILSETSSDKTNVENNEDREKVIENIVGYILETQF